MYIVDGLGVNKHGITKEETQNKNKDPLDQILTAKYEVKVQNSSFNTLKNMKRGKLYYASFVRKSHKKFKYKECILKHARSKLHL